MDTRLLAATLALIAAAAFLVNTAIGGGQTEQPNTFPATDTGTDTKYVTITFDDGYNSQYQAADALEARGMRGVFYVPIGQLNGSFEGIPTMTRSDVQDLQQRGHEIGGHTYNHTDLSALTTAEAEETILKNRDALQELGITPVSFAYPYGQGADTHQNTVTDYYKYARTVRWDTNTVPPDEPGQLKTLALTEDNYEVLDSYLDRMEGSDWLILSIHHIDEDGAVDRENVDVSRETYESILDQVDTANVIVTTFEEMQNMEG